MTKKWYVELTKQCYTDAYVEAATRDEAIKLAREGVLADGDYDEWTVTTASEFTEKDLERTG